MARVPPDRTAAPPDMRRVRYKLGDTVWYMREEHMPEGEKTDKASPKRRRQAGTVIYIHPRRRFVTVEYVINGYKFRESLLPTLVEKVRN